MHDQIADTIVNMQPQCYEKSVTNDLGNDDNIPSNGLGYDTSATSNVSGNSFTISSIGPDEDYRKNH